MKSIILKSMDNSMDFKFFPGITVVLTCLHIITGLRIKTAALEGLIVIIVTRSINSNNSSKVTVTAFKKALLTLMLLYKEVSLAYIYRNKIGIK